MTSVDRYTPYEKPLPIQLNSMTDSVRPFRVMTSGVFTAAHLALVPTLEALLGMKVLTVTTSIGTGENSIPNRLKRTEPVDLVIVAATNMRHFVDAGYILADSAMLIAKSSVAIAVREGAPPPDASCAEALKQTFLAANAIAYSASESGRYLTTKLYQKLEIDKDCLPKSIFVGQGERTGAVVARGDADIAFQQLSELKPVPGIAHITPLPLDLQPTVMVAAGVPGWSRNVEISRSIVRFLVSEKALTAIEESGLEPLWRCFDEDALTSFNFI